MARYLLNFGDSWAHGEGGGKFQKSNYANQLSLATGRQLIDLSRPGTSAAHMILQFQQFVQESYCPESDYLALFFVTAQERQLTFDDSGQAKEIHPGLTDFNQYYTSMYTDKLGLFNINTVIITLQSLSRYYGIDDRYLLGWQKIKLWPEISRSCFYQSGQTTMMELLGTFDIYECGQDGNTNFIPGDGHPSVAGHTQIAQALYPWIQG